MCKPKVLFALTMSLAVPGMLAGCAVERKCGLHGCPGDAQITANVQSSLAQHPEVEPLVAVNTIDRVVYLSGFVATGVMRAEAEDSARSVPDVSKVVDSIAVTQ